MRSLGLLFIALALTTGCKKDPPVAQPAPALAPAPEPAAAAAPPADLVAMFERAMALLETVVIATEAGEGDCDEIARNLEPIVGGPESGAMHALDAEPRFEEHGEAMAAEHAARVQDLMDRLLAQVMTCHEHSGVVESLAGLGLAGRKIDKPEGE